MIHDFYSLKELWRYFRDEFATELKSIVKLRDTASSRRELSLDHLEYIQKRLQTLQPLAESVEDKVNVASDIK